MQMGMVGLGRMGANMVRRLLRGGHECVVFDVSPNAVKLLAKDGETFGGMMTKTEDTPKPFWLYYFNVDGIDAAVLRVQKGGGQVLNGPMQVPGGSWIVQCLDPQGGMFALVAQQR